MCDEYLQSNQCSFNGTEARIGRTILGIHTPYVRALLGAIYENMGLETETISKTLKGVTSYKLPVSDKVLSNKKKLEHHMRLHENRDLFSDALQAASQPVEDGGLGIKSIFIEKDY